MRLLLVGYGKMGQLVAQLAREFGGEVVGVVDPQSDASTGTPHAMASFTTSPHGSVRLGSTKAVANA